MELTEDQKNSLKDALKHLKLTDAEQKEEFRAKILQKVSYFNRVQFPDKSKVAHNQLRMLAARTSKVMNLIDELTPTAWGLVFDNPKVGAAPKPKGFYEHKLDRVLETLINRCNMADQDASNWKNSRSKDVKKRDLLDGCLELFDQARPGEAQPKSGDFPKFVDEVYTLAGGDKLLNYHIIEVFKRR